MVEEPFGLTVPFNVAPLSAIEVAGSVVAVNAVITDALAVVKFKIVPFEVFTELTPDTR